MRIHIDRTKRDASGETMRSMRLSKGMGESFGSLGGSRRIHGNLLLDKKVRMDRCSSNVLVSARRPTGVSIPNANLTRTYLRRRTLQDSCVVKRGCRSKALRGERNVDASRGKAKASEGIQADATSLFALCLFAWLLLGQGNEAYALDLDESQRTFVHGMNPPQEFLQMASDDSFWTNMVRYFQYFISLTVGLLYVNLKPLFNLMKKPGTAIFAIVFLYGAFTFVKLTVTSMLGLDDPSMLE